MRTVLSSLFLIVSISTFAQTYTRRDSLQGGLRPERTNFDVQRYDLNITVDPDKKFISGYNDIIFKVIETTNRIQLDLFENMKIDSIVVKGNPVKYYRDNDAVFIRITSKERPGKFELKISGWKQAGLLKPSVIRIHKIAALQTDLIVKKIGKLNKADKSKLNNALKSFFVDNVK